MAVGYIKGLCYTQSNGKKRYESSKLKIKIIQMSWNGMNKDQYVGLTHPNFQNDWVSLDYSGNKKLSPIKTYSTKSDNANEYAFYNHDNSYSFNKNQVGVSNDPAMSFCTFYGTNMGFLYWYGGYNGSSSGSGSSEETSTTKQNVVGASKYFYGLKGFSYSFTVAESTQKQIGSNFFQTGSGDAWAKHGDFVIDNKANSISFSNIQCDLGSSDGRIVYPNTFSAYTKSITEDWPSGTPLTNSSAWDKIWYNKQNYKITDKITVSPSTNNYFVIFNA